MDEQPVIPSSLSPQWLDIFILVGAVGLVALAAFLWFLIVYAGKPPRKNRHRHHHHPDREKIKKSAGGLKELIQKRRHRHRREPRPINPTLAQTGGLPPVRGEEEPPPPTSPP